MPTQEKSNYQQILDSGKLVRLDPRLLPGDLPCRVFLAVPDAVAWMKRELPTMKRDGYIDGEILPKEQAMNLIAGFVAGRSFEPPLPHDMRDNGAGVWELRTDDLRFFGWFPQKGMFCLSAVETKRACKDHGLYAGFKSQAIRHRDTIGLFGGTFIVGELHDLL